MQEFGPKYDAEILQNKKRMEACDVLCFVFDSGDVNSFGYIASLRSRFNLDDIPCVIVATKSDCDLVQQVKEEGVLVRITAFLYLIALHFATTSSEIRRSA